MKQRLVCPSRPCAVRVTRALNAVALLAVMLIPVAGCAERERDRHAASAGAVRTHAAVVRRTEYWDGECKVERSWEANGDYRDERKCEDAARTGRTDDGGPAVQRGVVVQPPSVMANSPGSAAK